jgi:plasmid stabilization system protein ParE
MDRKLIWTEKASGDIEAIVRYIARRDPKAAARIGFGIYERVQILLQHPEAGTILDELREGGWHKLIFRRWKIVYTLRGDHIIIGRV